MNPKLSCNSVRAMGKEAGGVVRPYLLLEEAAQKICAGKGSQGLEGIGVRHDTPQSDCGGGRPLCEKLEPLQDAV